MGENGRRGKMKKYKVWFKNGQHRVVELSKEEYSDLIDWLKFGNTNGIIEIKSLIITTNSIDFIEDAVKYH